RGRRRVDPPLRFRLGDALHAVAAAFIAEAPVDLVAGYAEDDFLVPPLLARAEGDLLDLPALVAGVLRVHPIEVAREDRRLVAAGARPDFHDDAAVVLALGQEQVFQAVVQGLAARL